MMHIEHAHDPHVWDDFVKTQLWRPFLQSWTMGEVYKDIGQTPLRLIVQKDHETQAVCFGHVVLAKRGKHISVPYGPLVDETLPQAEIAHITENLVRVLKKEARKHGCTFIRFSPFWPQGRHGLALEKLGSISSPLHLLAEHIWYIPLRGMENGKWKMENSAVVSEDEIFAGMRKTTRNLIRRAEKEGVIIEASKDSMKDLPLFLKLHDETRKRHGFTAYTDAFFESQVERFSKRKECTLYLARHQGNVIAASIHMHAFGETSYHHGASAGTYSKIPASYLLQWTAIKDALKRGDRIYNFWGIAPSASDGTPQKDHPFAGVTLFKTGFGGDVLHLAHCKDAPVTSAYWLTYMFEKMRKWKRGF